MIANNGNFYNFNINSKVKVILITILNKIAYKIHFSLQKVIKLDANTSHYKNY